MTPKTADVTGLVLAGGRVRRMGGLDKGLQLYRDRPLAAWAMSRLAPQVASVWVNANRHLATYESFAAQICTDATPDFAGPLAGIVAGLAHCRTPYLATVPCDCPEFPLDLVTRLADGLAGAGAELATAIVREGQSCRAQPVFSLMRADLLARLRQDMADGERKVDRWMARQRRVEVVFDDPGAFTNINTLADLQRLD